MPFLKALLFLWCFLPLRFRDMRRISRLARRRASSSDGGSPDGGFGMGGAPPPRVSLTASSFLKAFRASFTFLGDLSFLWSLNSFLATCSASFLSRMTCVIASLYCVCSTALRVALSRDAKAVVSGRRGAPRRRRQGRR